MKKWKRPNIFKARLPKLSAKRTTPQHIEEPEVLPAESESNFLPIPVAGVNTESINVLSQVEKAGFTHLAEKLRELQPTEGIAALDTALGSLNVVESVIQKKLEALKVKMASGTLDTEDLPDLAKLVKAIENIFVSKAKMMLLPMGSIHPRSITPKQQSVAPKVNIGTMNMGVGGGNIIPKRKQK